MVFRPIYILILGGTIAVDYLAGIAIANATGGSRKAWLWASIIANVGVLAAFKYWNFLNDNLTAALGFGQLANPVPYLDILLPVGLSFHTFQAMSYTIEVYRGRQAPERHLGIYALYVMFYPQLVAGPIERPQNVLHQFYERHHFTYTAARAGLLLMAFGLFKKMIIADRIAPISATVFDHADRFIGLPLLLAPVLFAFQIYCDFSGYSDVALGSAQVMGFSLMRNFKQPYFSSSIGEFWTRWHISLTSWFRDYIYIPLGGNKIRKAKHIINLLFVFTLSGLWHGAALTYICWGFLNGVYRSIEVYISSPLYYKFSLLLRGFKTIYKPIQILITFLFISIGWVFFRSPTLDDAFHFFIKGWQSLPDTILNANYNLIDGNYLGATPFDWFIIVFALVVLFCIEQIQLRISARLWLSKQRTIVRYGLYIGLISSILFLPDLSQSNQFIYFQF
jgi:alginate O-acetyltransferase complex protein AlgI